MIARLKDVINKISCRVRNPSERLFPMLHNFIYKVTIVDDTKKKFVEGKGLEKHETSGQLDDVFASTQFQTVRVTIFPPTRRGRQAATAKRPSVNERAAKKNRGLVFSRKTKKHPSFSSLWLPEFREQIGGTVKRNTTDREIFTIAQLPCDSQLLRLVPIYLDLSGAIFAIPRRRIDFRLFDSVHPKTSLSTSNRISFREINPRAFSFTPPCRGKSFKLV